MSCTAVGTPADIVNTKDPFYLCRLKGVVDLEDALDPPPSLTPDDDVADALGLSRKERRPLAVVRDATGEAVGVIAMGDELEQTVGGMEDEHDRPTPKVRLGRKPPCPPQRVNP